MSEETKLPINDRLLELSGRKKGRLVPNRPKLADSEKASAKVRSSTDLSALKAKTEELRRLRDRGSKKALTVRMSELHMEAIKLVQLELGLKSLNSALEVAIDEWMQSEEFQGRLK